MTEFIVTILLEADRLGAERLFLDAMFDRHNDVKVKKLSINRMAEDDLCVNCQHLRSEHIGYDDKDKSHCRHIDKAHAQCCSDDYCECKIFRRYDDA